MVSAAPATLAREDVVERLRRPVVLALGMPVHVGHDLALLIGQPWQPRPRRFAVGLVVECGLLSKPCSAASGPSSVASDRLRLAVRMGLSVKTPLSGATFGVVLEIDPNVMSHLLGVRKFNALRH